MNNTIKSLVFVSIGLIIWTGFVYLAFAFVKTEVNPFVWSQYERVGMISMIFSYLYFIPLLVMLSNEEF